MRLAQQQHYALEVRVSNEFSLMNELMDGVIVHQTERARVKIAPIDPHVMPYAEMAIAYALGARAYDAVGARANSRLTIGEKRGILPKGYTGDIPTLRRTIVSVLRTMGEEVTSTYSPADANVWSVTGIQGDKGDAHFKVSAPAISVSDAQTRYAELIARVKAGIRK